MVIGDAQGEISETGWRVIYPGGGGGGIIYSYVT